MRSILLFLLAASAFGQNAVIRQGSVAIRCSAASASGTAYTCSTSPTFTPVTGTRLTFIPDVDSGASPTLNMNGSGAAGIFRQGGQTAVGASEMKAGKPVVLTFDAASHWDVADLNVSGATPGAPAGSLQFNNAGAFGGVAGSSWNGTETLTFTSVDLIADTMMTFSNVFAGGADGSILNINPNFDAPPDTAGATGTDGGFISISAGLGGNTTIATLGAGGAGGPITLSAGRGGQALSANADQTGGQGGNLSLGSGSGASANGTGTVKGGLGGGVLVFAGTGGNASGGTINIGGSGSDIVVLNGSGGTGSTSNGTDGRFLLKGGARANANIAEFQLNAGTPETVIRPSGALGNAPCTAATLATVIANAGDQCYCTDCKVTSALDNTCTGAGGGAMAFKIAAANKCVQ